MRGTTGSPGAAAARGVHAVVWRTYLALGILWMAAHASGFLGPLEDATFVIAGGGSIGAGLYGLRAHRVARPLPWLLMVVAMVIWIIGGALRVQLETLGDLTESRALLPDVFSVAGYVLTGIGLVILHHRRYSDRGRDLDALLDAIVAAAAVAAIIWVAILVPALDAEAPSTRIELLLVGYPVLTVLLTTLVLRFSFSASRHEGLAHRLLVTALCCLFVGDVVYMVIELDLVDLPSPVVDLPYGLAFLCVGATMAHPSVAHADQPVDPSPGRANRFRLVAVGLALGVPAVLILLGEALQYRDRVMLGVIGLVLAAGAMWRIMRAINALTVVQRHLTMAATHDALTTLPNRVYLSEHLGDLDGEGTLIGALFVDLDRFKLINDGLGHATGDSLLRAVGARLRESAGTDDFIARVGGDEFVVITRSDARPDIEDLAERLRCSLGVPFRIGNSEIYVSMSVGVRIADAMSQTEVETILEDADSALYQAKRRGRNTVVVFDHTMREWSDRQLLIEQELNNALDAGEISVEYQPIVRLPDGTLEGFEALARWEHPVMGDVPPSVFIPVAEETGLILDIGAWILHEACGQLRRWRDAGIVGQVTMSVNLSPRQLLDRRLHDMVADVLAGNDLGTGALQLEITEGMLADDPVAARRILNGLREAGVRISLDDFGTGYSSIAQLKSFPLDSAKIDRSFVRGVGFAEPSSDESLIAAIVAMSEALGFRTIAEGVTTVDQAVRLFELGVRSAQGYYYAEPAAAERMVDVLASIRQKLPS